MSIQDLTDKTQQFRAAGSEVKGDDILAIVKEVNADYEPVPKSDETSPQLQKANFADVLDQYFPQKNNSA